MTSDEYAIGCRQAADLGEHARERLLASHAWAWSARRLAGFLEIHEADMRAVRCGCYRCPIHRDIERPTSPESN